MGYFGSCKLKFLGLTEAGDADSLCSSVCGTAGLVVRQLVSMGVLSKGTHLSEVLRQRCHFLP